MGVLFKAEPYWKIIKILDKKEEMSEESFEQALLDAFESEGLDEADRQWATNYLKSYRGDLAAASDAKWPVHPDARKLHW
jgi:hypothetical protein